MFRDSSDDVAGSYSQRNYAPNALYAPYGPYASQSPGYRRAQRSELRRRAGRRFSLLLIGLVLWMTLAMCASARASGSPAPSVALLPGAGDLNMPITISGQDFPPLEMVYIVAEGPVTQSVSRSLGMAQVDNSGRFQVSVLLPQSWNSGLPVTEQTLTLRAVTEDYRQQATARFQLNAP